QQALARLNSMAEFDSFTSNHTTYRRVDFGVTQIEFCSADVCSRLAHLANTRLRLCFCVAYPFRSCSGRPNLGLPLQDKFLHLRNLLFFSTNQSKIGINRLSVCQSLRLARIIVQMRHNPSVNQALVANAVAFGARSKGLVLLHSVLG